jgi:ATP diphosphatase
MADHRLDTPLDRLVAIMARLRDPDGGCPWDLAQDFRTIAPYTIEEAYEVADAIERDDMAALKDELGDLLLQVVYQSCLAEERGAFAIGHVVDAICDKMVRRHPHVFGDTASPGWETLKADERSRAAPDQGALAGVALALPALKRAEKIQKRAARVGFDWPDSDGARAKLLEEIGEVERSATTDEQVEEVGDMLFAAVNWSRHLGVAPEEALRQATKKFEARFRAMEAIAGAGFPALSLADKDALWDRVKAGGHPAGKR